MFQNRCAHTTVAMTRGRHALEEEERRSGKGEAEEVVRKAALALDQLIWRAGHSKEATAFGLGGVLLALSRRARFVLALVGPSASLKLSATP